MALHSSHNHGFKGKIVCGMPIMPFKTNIDGPANMGFQTQNSVDIIEEAFTFFRVNVLFKNYEIVGPADKFFSAIYSSSHRTCKFTFIRRKDEPSARKRLGDVISAPVPLPKDKNNFMSMMLEDGPYNERQIYSKYIKQLKQETVNRFINRFYGQGVVQDDFKFWMGLGKKKFLGMNFTSMF